MPANGGCPTELLVHTMTNPGFQLRENLVYAVHDGVELRGDLYLPAGEGPFPVLVNVHGGYWRRGARATFRYWGPYLAARGYAGFTVGYRLTRPGVKTYPEAVHDIRAAVQFVRGEAGAFKLDPERVALFGNSAGAHLAAMVALAGDEAPLMGACPQDAHGSLSTRVKALIGVYGIYDLAAMWRQSQIVNPGDNLVQSFLGVAPMQDRRRYFDASPISYATVDRSGTAIYLSWGDADDVVDPRAQSEPFLLALKQAGFFVRSCIVPGAQHYWLNEPIEEAGSQSGFFAPRLLRFLAERL
jgi:acetyl esterase/lipase